MTLKPTEEFVKDCLIKYFGSNITKAQEGEDPPDIYLTINNKKIAVEITRLSPISFDQNGTAQNRNTQDCFAAKLISKLDSKLRDIIPSEMDITLTIYVPVMNPRKYKRDLFEYLKRKLENGVTVGEKEEVELLGSKVRISFVPRRNQSQKKIAGIIVNKNSNADVQKNAKVILEDRILDKANKCKKIQFQGLKWLALFNDYWPANYNTYARALNNISVKHDFGSIFIISDEGQVNQIKTNREGVPSQ
jgi:DNA-binding transcriptional regulator/RsmH inhibitor MraZ